MNEISQYPSIYQIGHKVIRDIFSTPVIVEEKVDGSQFSFTKFADGTWVARSKGAIIDPLNPNTLFAPAVQSMVDRLGLLKAGWTYRGEALCRPKHNALAYDRAPNGGVILFDIDDGLQNFMSRSDKECEATRIGLEVVPVLFEGKVDSFEQLHKLLELDSILGGVKIEGFVVKNYELFGPDKKILLGKYVSEAFKEKHRTEWKNSNPGRNDVINNLITIYKHENRWKKAVQHLTEAGQLEGTPKDIGLLIKEVNKDIYMEEAENIKETLFQWGWKQIEKSLTKGMAEWYKSELAKQSFKGE